jgi:hypothetical protein
LLATNEAIDDPEESAIRSIARYWRSSTPPRLSTSATAVTTTIASVTRTGSVRRRSRLCASARTASYALPSRTSARPSSMPSAKRRSGRLASSFSTMKRRPPGQPGSILASGGGSACVICSASIAALVPSKA